MYKEKPLGGDEAPNLMEQTAPKILPPDSFDRMLCRVFGDGKIRQRLSAAFNDSYRRTQSHNQTRMNLHYLPLIPGNDQLLTDFSTLTTLDSEYTLSPGFRDIRSRLREGKNAVLVANHSSYVDFLFTHRVIGEAEPTLQADYVTISSKVISAGWKTLWDGKNRIPVYPEVYFHQKSDMKVPDAPTMHSYNASSLRALIQLAKEGGRLFMVYANMPGKGGEYSKSGEILRALRDDAGRECILYPTRIESAQMMASPSPKFTETMEALKPLVGGVNVGDGEPITSVIGKRGEYDDEEIFQLTMAKIKAL